ncbi:MAG TPA: hypothetical protein VNX68_08995 [Nitrosopumilaceae archaeon]|nr:hypothetical protein [Nitrosopumilaceae archaeon]
MENNPYLQVHDPFPEQRALKAKIDEEEIEFQRLCYEIFHMNADGIKLFEMIKKRYLLQALWSPTDKAAPTLSLWFGGFKEALNGLWLMGNIHARRIAGEFIQS